MSDRLRRTIFAACRELGLDADARHDMQMAVTGKASLSDMTEAELQLVVDNLKDKGFTLHPKGRRGRAPRADLRLVHVLWKLLGEAGVLERAGRDGLNAFIRSRFGSKWGSVPADIDMLRDPAQIEAVIRALKHMCRRNGVELEGGYSR